ncbi:hypothetical protein BDY19DRAFT_908124 [Irpex rosettiformis]|uniref:Uncharacterized protein n=1 Tax=Irpex rosettiformis TaxID=378272 RepID=A0ACB8TXI2_9APHY|nr:hypothetical protein BDY19DRAFT_908124 [Irpex rosettiformis]
MYYYCIHVKQLSPWPVAYRYANVWPTRKQAKGAVNTARAVFKIIIASIVYASSLVPEDWLKFLHRHDTLTTEETNLIRRSPICQTTDWISGEPFQRTGCILDMRVDFPLAFLQKLKRITEKYNLPIWFYYGDSLSHRHTNPWYDVYLPSDTDIKTCKMYGHSVTAMNWNNDRFGDNTWNTASPTVSYPSTSRTGWSPPMHQPHTGPNSPQPSSPLSSSPFDHLISSPALTSTRPPITASQRVGAIVTAPTSHLRNSKTRQYPGQTSSEFFAEVDRENERRMAKMGNEERAKVLARMEQHKELHCPNKSHQCAVFVWCIGEDETYIRTYLPLQKWSSTFQETTPSQRRYDPVRNEFDVCESLDLNAVTDEDNDYAHWDHQHPSWKLFLERSRQAPMSIGRERLYHQWNICTVKPVIRSHLHKSPAQGIRQQIQLVMLVAHGRDHQIHVIRLVRHTAGHLTVLSTSNRHSTDRRLTDQDLTPHPVELIPNATGPVFSPEDMPDHLAVLTQYIGVNRTATIPHSPSNEWPTAKAVRQILGCIHADWDTQTMELARGVISILAQSMLAINTIPVHLLDVDPRFPQRHLSRQRPDLIIRTWQDQHLGPQGIPFKTLQLCQTISQFPRAPPMPMFHDKVPLRLGTVPYGFIFTVDQYQKYEYMRDRVINSHHGRAAVLASGILWRLAMEADIDKLAVLRGPSGFHTRDDHMWIGGRDYIDDLLSRHQEDIICGVYRVLPEKSNEGLNRSAWRSWWPSASTWAASGMSTNF